MLPVRLYNIAEPSGEELLRFLRDIIAPQGFSYALEEEGMDAEQAAALAASAAGAVLFLIGVDRLKPKGDLTALKLCRRVVRANRSHYVVPVLAHAGDLEDVLSVCSYLAGVLCLPLTARRVESVFRTVVQDYASQQQALMPKAGSRVIVLQADNTSYRVPVDSVRYAQAVDKKIEIVLSAQTLQLYANMEEMLERLGEGFQRCHRSYIVNRTHIQSIDWTNMLIMLSDGSSVPLSRSYRSDFREEYA